MSLSVCIITRDNEETIDRCIKSVQEVADQIVVVDTGSFDKTVEIAKKYTDCVHIHPWNHDFAKSRNHSLEYATGKWILWMDSDDELCKESIPALAILKERDLELAFYLTVENIGDYDIGYVQARKFEQIRMFRNLPIIQFKGRVHEMATESIELAGHKLARIPEEEIRINHYGYENEDMLMRKMFRNHRIRLFEQGVPDDTIFLEFKIDEYFCFYTPNFIAIFREMKFVGSADLPPEITRDEIFLKAESMIENFEKDRNFKPLSFDMFSYGNVEANAKDEFSDLSAAIDRVANNLNL